MLLYYKPIKIITHALARAQRRIYGSFLTNINDKFSLRLLIIKQKNYNA